MAWSDYPEQVRALPQVGDAFAVNVEQVVALRPDLVLAWDGGTPREVIERLMNAVDADSANAIHIDVEAMQVRTPVGNFPFELSARHRRMFLEGLDMIGLSLTQRDEIEQFARRYWDAFPWARDVARRTRDRLGTT